MCCALIAFLALSTSSNMVSISAAVFLPCLHSCIASSNNLAMDTFVLGSLEAMSIHGASVPQSTCPSHEAVVGIPSAFKAATVSRMPGSTGFPSLSVMRETLSVRSCHSCFLRISNPINYIHYDLQCAE